MHALVELAQRQRVFLVGAVWTRFLPIHATVKQGRQAGQTGAVRALQSSFWLDRPFKPGDRRCSAALAGGTLLDIGIDNIAVSRLALPGVPVQGFDLRGACSAAKAATRRTS
jgi:predicted dehydrogenase